MTHTVPQGFGVKGVSTLYGADGAVRAQWVKSKADEQDKLTQLVDAMTDSWSKWSAREGIRNLPEAEPGPPPS